ncbi:hypothetical protein HPB47_000671 [Ixodes persulcatus]|uniref:Uncharacterized protein n=1 Tax=Ixodes persulcatus TaxID=34615 RepID=A0AC60PR44_IXOPE|nr:hypothetical protein HPB47_000671 [Ixodes persulcatus]
MPDDPKGQNLMSLRPFAPPPVFRGKADEDLEDWLHLYERYGRSLAWTDEQKADNLVFALEDVARRWYVTALREQTPETWVSWQKALRETFAGDHVQEWAYIRLQEKRQQPGETPQQYVSGILQLCTRVNAGMPDAEKLRYLLRGLRPEMMERVAISNPRTTQEFLQQLQRLTHVGAMARHALMTMPTHPLPGLHTESPVLAPGPDLGSAPGGAGTLSNPTEVFYTPRQDVPDRSTAAVLGAMQETLRALTAAVDRLGQRDRRPFPPRGSRNQGGQVVCFRCNRVGHIMRQCPEAPAPQTPVLGQPGNR